MPFLNIGSRLGYYEILERLGSGGMGEVYRARDLRLGREVAVKILADGTGRDQVSRFEKEARLASSLNHPNIVTIYDIDCTSPTPYIAMELVPGQTLRESLKSGRLSFDKLVPIAMQIADALSKAHAAGVVHRDLKPENLMITGDGLVKVLDFGLSKRMGQMFSSSAATPTTNSGIIVGTVDYMSPEQAAGKEIDFRSDQFSFGTVLYELATGNRPFHRDSAVQTMSAIIESSHPPLARTNPDVPQFFARLVDRCLEKSPNQRFESTRMIADELRSQSGAIIKPKANLRWPFAAAAAITLVLALGALISLNSGRVRNLVTLRQTVPPIPEKRNLVVLPFRAVGGGQSQIFANGLTESVISKLTQLTILPSLQVEPASEIRTRQVNSADDARKLLGANLIVAGSIEESSGAFRIHCSLIDAASFRQIATDDIRASTSELTIQDQIAAAIIQMLGIHLKPEERQLLEQRDTAVAAANRLYLEGRGYFENFDRMENVDRAIQTFQEAIKADPDDAAAYAAMGEAYLRKFEAAKETDRINDTQAACESALRLNDKLAEGHSCLGRLYRATGRYPDAIAELDRALTIEPTNDDVYRELATAQQRAGLVNEAEMTFRRAIALRPHYWANYNRQGTFYFEQGRYDDAVGMFKQVTVLAPDSVFGYTNLGGTYVQLGRYADAIPILEKSVSIRPSALGYSNLATAYYNRRQFADAVRNYEHAVKLNAKNYLLWGNLGDAYYSTPGRRAESVDAYRKAISLAEGMLAVNPRDSATLARTAEYYAMTDNMEEASRLLARATSVAPNDPFVHFKTAIIRNHFSDVNGALDSLEKAVQHGYSSTIIRDAPEFDNLWSQPRFQQLIRGK